MLTYIKHKMLGSQVAVITHFGKIFMELLSPTLK